MNSIGSLASGLLHAVLPSSLLPNNTTASNLVNIASPSVSQPPDVGQLSSFAQIAGTLQQLQLSNPAQYQRVTQQVAANLQSAAQTAQASGNTTAASQLNQLASDFTAASTTGQLPNLQDLASAIGHHAHRHHLNGGADSNAGSSVGTPTLASASNNATPGSASQVLTQFLASLQANQTQTSALNPATIIQNTLTGAGISAIAA